MGSPISTKFPASNKIFEVKGISYCLIGFKRSKKT